MAESKWEIIRDALHYYGDTFKNDLELRDKALAALDELGDEPASPVRVWRARAEKAEARVAQLERALATLHTETTKGGSF